MNRTTLINHVPKERPRIALILALSSPPPSIQDGNYRSKYARTEQNSRRETQRKSRRISHGRPLDSVQEPRTSGSLITRSLLEIFIVPRVNGALWQERAKLAEINANSQLKTKLRDFSRFWHVARTDAAVSRAISQKIFSANISCPTLVATGFPSLPVQLSTPMFPIVFAIGFQSRSQPIPGSIF